MSTPLASLRDRPYPQLWAIFEWITRIPRPSGREGAFRDHLINRAVSRGWSTRCDLAGNLVIAVDGCGDLADAPTLVLQGHLDMVCEKNSGVSHDFEHDPIPAYVDGDWIRSAGTTLGADNGIAIALALAIAEDHAEHRVPLELLFTIEEETGLIGATRLDPDIVSGRRLINLDSEEDGLITIGCAGGMDLTASFPRVPQIACANAAFRIRISGLRGGHSGVNIHEGRANAIAAAARLALRLRGDCPQLRLLTFTGGSKRNAIPREAEVTVCGCGRGEAELQALRLQTELRLSDADASVTVSDAVPSASGVPFAVAEFIQGCPMGILRWDPRLPDLVRTSNSIGVITCQADTCTLVAAGRSSSEDEMDQLAATFEQYCVESGGSFSSNNRYPGWLPDPRATIVGDVCRAWQETHGSAPRIAAIHAGLESGIIGERLGTAQVVSCGPTIHNAHSPDEQVQISSTERIFRFLQTMTRTR